MSKLMLIDAAHPEETRVALVTNGQVDDFDFETAGKEQLRGNIYLAKVTRVEPSLQAAFVEYGGHRHGFLAFSEIHPDYYQLPQEDREALLKEAAEAAAEEGDEIDLDEDDESGDENAGDAEAGAGNGDEDEDEGSGAELKADEADEEDDDASAGDNDAEAPRAKAEAKPQRRRARRPNLQKRYKIQEVIRRRQVMLVQVVKEERGNKGAALTTYLSLAGRYSVLMPNTPRGGGISRKISNGADRKRLKSIMGELDVPHGMGLIVRTAGAKRTKAEIKRDYDYLTKLWDTIREKTLSSMAPCLIHEEAGLVHRAMRDLYDKDVEEVLIEGEDAYKEAKDLAKLLMPSHAKKVKPWKEAAPLFVDQDVEDQLDSIFTPTVKMKSGGYLVINQTEALVAIDVNSGKSTRERNIEQTALRTNLEAAEEACRQMRLRDLAGLIVIDFIDMDEAKNNRAVEKKLKDCLKHDRARVQHGRLSQFGLMEISRQRRRAGVLQATSDPCPSCDGTGRIRSVSSAALQLLRALEARAAGGGLLSITAEAPTDVALYLLNNKRDAVSRLEEAAGFAIAIKSSDSMLTGDFVIHAEKDPDYKPPRRRRRRAATERDEAEADAETGLEVIDAEEDEDDAEESSQAAEDETEARETSEDGDSGKRKRRRRGRRGGRRRRRNAESDSQEAAETSDASAEKKKDDVDTPAGPVVETGSAPTPEPPKRTPKPDHVPEDGGAYLDGLSTTAAEMMDAANEESGEAEPKAAPDETPTTAAIPESALPETGEADAVQAGDDTPKTAEAPPEPEPDAESEPDAAQAAQADETQDEAEDDRPKRRGWWSRRRAG